MDKTGSYGKDGQLWKRRAVMEKTSTYGKTGTYGKDGHLWKRRVRMEKTGIKHLKARFFTHTGHSQYYAYNTSYKTSLSIFRTHRKRIIDLSSIPNVLIWGLLMRFIIGFPRTYNKRTHLTF